MKKVVLLSAFALGSCAPEGSVEPIGGSCAVELEETNGLTEGVAWSFFPDPIVSSRDPWLSPLSSRLDEHRVPVELSNLAGTGVLRGTRLEVRNILSCDGGFNAFSEKNQFLYSHGEEAFQEAMNYEAGDAYLAFLESSGVSASAGRTVVYAHCMLEDNAFFVRSSGSTDEGNLHEICLGNSVITPGASYADDGAVVIHELQHGATLEAYSPFADLNRLWSDEAGALNEGLSDFMALMFMDPRTDETLDPRVFSRWALGQFVPGMNVARGAHRCPEYDPGYPDCEDFAGGADGFSAIDGRVSFTYPDGVGWPFADNFTGPGKLRDIHERWSSVEEIHNNGIVITGALWDVYESLLEEGSLSKDAAGSRMAFAVHSALGRLPLPSEEHHSPVSLPGFAGALIEAVSETASGWSESEVEMARTALTHRGLLGFEPVVEDWGQPGAGDPETPGVRILDNAVSLRVLASRFGASIEEIPSTLRVNGKLDPGEWALIWFDIENTSTQTVAGVNLEVSSLDSRVEILDGSWNIGATWAGAQIQYFKIHGTSIVQALASEDPDHHVPVGSEERAGRSSYFLSSPFFDKDAKTGIWIRAADELESGDEIVLRVVARPSNGAASVMDFPLVIP